MKNTIVRRNWATFMESEIRNKKNTMTSEDFLDSPYLKMYIEQRLKVILGNDVLSKRPITLHFVYKNSNMTAYTNGQNVYVNVYCSFVKNFYPNKTYMYYALLGLTIHECCHILYTDFVLLNKQMNIMENNKVPFKLIGKTDKAVAREMKDFFTKYQALRPFATKTYHIIQNILEDVYIENRGKFESPGEFAYGIDVMNRPMFDKFNLNDCVSAYAADEITGFLMSFTNLLQMYAYERELDEDTLDPTLQPYYSRLKQMLLDLDEPIRDICYECDSEKRLDDLNVIFVYVFENFIKNISLPENPESDSNQEGQSEGENQENNPGDPSGENGNSELSQEVLDNLIQTLSNIEEGQSESPVGYTRPIDANSFDEKPKSEDIKQMANLMTENAKNEEQLEVQMENVINSIARDEAESAMQYEFARELTKEADGFNAGVSSYQYKIERKNVYAYNESSYMMRKSRLDSIVRGSVRPIKRVLEEVSKKTNVSRGHIMGRFDSRQVATHAFFNDGRVFTRKDQITRPDVSWGILVDCSGSMDGENMDAAKDLAYILNGIFSALDNTYLLVGHDCTSLGHKDICRLNVVHDFQTMDRNDDKRIETLEAMSGNMDAGAIKYMCEKLLQQTDKKKVLFVISDGLPTETTGIWSNTDALDDTIQCVAEYRRKGVEIIGVIIDGYEYGMKQIHEIYGNRTLDCRDLSKLNDEIVSIVKRYVLR